MATRNESKLGVELQQKRHFTPPPAKVGRGRLHRIVDWEGLALEACYCAPRFAQLCDVSLRHMQRHFRQQYGLRLKEWLNELRLCHAYQRLVEGYMVKEVAYSLGYKQVSHFSREFKRYHGVSPSSLQAETWAVPRGSQEPRFGKDPAAKQLTLF